MPAGTCGHRLHPIVGACPGARYSCPPLSPSSAVASAAPDGGPRPCNNTYTTFESWAYGTHPTGTRVLNLRHHALGNIFHNFRNVRRTVVHVHLPAHRPVGGAVSWGMTAAPSLSTPPPAECRDLVIVLHPPTPGGTASVGEDLPNGLASFAVRTAGAGAMMTIVGAECLVQCEPAPEPPSGYSAGTAPDESGAPPPPPPPPQPRLPGPAGGTLSGTAWLEDKIRHKLHHHFHFTRGDYLQVSDDARRGEIRAQLRARVDFADICAPHWRCMTYNGWLVSLTPHQREFETAGAAGPPGMSHYGRIFNSGGTSYSRGAYHYAWNQRGQRDAIERDKAPGVQFADCSMQMRGGLRHPNRPGTPELCAPV